MKRTCGECPFLRNVPTGRFNSDRYRALASTCDRSYHGFPQPVFACHKTHEGSDLACAGFLIVVGFDNISVRLASLQGRVDLGRVEASGPLYESFNEMARANGYDPDTD